MTSCASLTVMAQRTTRKAAGKHGGGRPRRFKNPEQMKTELAGFFAGAIGKDADGNDVMLVSGPYGIYAQYKGHNINVQDPFTADAAAIIENAEAVANGAPKNLVRKYEDYEGKPLEMLRGRYGAYIKWGDRNCALKGDEKKDPMSITEERAREIALSAPEPQKRAYRRRTASK